MVTLRKFFMTLTFLFAIHAHAQEHFTLWYGVNYAGETNSSYYNDDDRFKFLNVGLDYTDKIAEKWDWTVGAALNSKGVHFKASYIQVEGNASYCLAEDGRTKLSAFTGPYMGVKVLGNESDWDGGSMNYNTFSCGWQAGLGFTYSCLVLKLGYEHAFTNIESDLVYSHKTYQWFARVGLRF